MESRFYTKFKSINKNFYCLFLFFRNAITIRSLKIYDINIYDSVIIEGNEITLFWNTKGCHKIKINGAGTLPGNSKGVKLRLLDVSKPLIVWFYGINKTYKKQLFYNGTKFKLLNQFHIQSHLPTVSELPKVIILTTTIFSNSDLIAKINISKFEFESFDSDKFNIN